MDVNGNVAVRHTVWVWVDMPSLNWSDLMLAKCYPGAPAVHDGLVTPNFLDGCFTEWCGETDASGYRQFCVER
jgi:hypothetical protein